MSGRLLPLALLVVLAGPAYPGSEPDETRPVAPSAAEELLTRSLGFHDPDGRWGGRTVELTWSSTNPDGKERILLAMTFAPDGSFEMSGHYREIGIEYSIEGDEVRARVDGRADLDDATREKVHLHREGGKMWRNYFRFLAGLPMNLADPGAHIDPATERTEFMGRSVESVRVTYDPEVGTDTWLFYFLPDTAELVGCRFTKADLSNPGEYIVFGGLIEANGLRLPRSRRWFMSDDDRFLGEDTITRLVVR